MSKLLWTPTADRISSANITKFKDYVNNQRNLSISGYSELYEFSTKHPDQFWGDFWKFSSIISSSDYTSVVSDITEFPPKTKWFTGAKLNFAENLLKFRGDHVALKFQSELGGSTSLTYAQLYDRVAKLAHSLSHLNINTGDRIVGYMPNMMETIIAMLAATSLGATWASCGAELGGEAALDRLGQIKPKVLFSVDGYWYKGKSFDQIPKLEKLVNGIPSLEKVVILPFVNESVKISLIPNSVLFDDFLSDEDNLQIDFKQLPFDHPQYIMFSSGTTGKPKCMVQSAGGVLINHLKELILSADLNRDDSLLYLSSPSWMMWNWLVTGLAVGATIVLWEGNPLHPNWKRLWKFIQDEKVTIFGCSATYLHYLKGIEAKPGKEFDLSDLKEISQTGSALSPEGFEYVYKYIKADLHLNSISGGTDINGCFVGGTPTLPVISGELQGLALGMKVAAYGENEQAVFDEQGELVCEIASPSMPIYFWNDPDNEKYENAYFRHFERKKVWRHGDYIKISSETGGVTFYGRSDSTLKPSGVRIGTSEIILSVE
ncbi:MAG: acetoacetate--CoA ligase [Chloroflexi bacterium]|nr:acetoacetate--CoA ligase [Chloroflexota bacterium]